MKKARQPQMNADQKAILGWFLARVHLRLKYKELNYARLRDDPQRS